MAQIEKRGEQNYRIRIFLGRIDGKRKYKEEVFQSAKERAFIPTQGEIRHPIVYFLVSIR